MTALNHQNDIDMQVVTSSSDMVMADVSMYSIDTRLTEQDQDQDCTQEQEPTQRSVRFSVVEEFEYEKLDLTEELRDQLWYTMEDMVALAKHELRLCEESSSGGGANKKNGRCWRGFEHMQGGRDNRADRVAAVIDSILDAYDELAYDSDQYKTEDDKAEALRQECRVLTRDDRKRAYKFGLKDQTVAETLQKTSASSSDSKSSKRSKSSASNSKGDKTSSSSSSSSSNRGRSTKEDERRLKRSKRSKEGVTAAVKSQQKQKPMVADPAMGSPERPPVVMAPIRCA